ncbi:MAG: PQQ-binding-like beta-propeller repeat protein [Bacteroidota bacterium]
MKQKLLFRPGIVLLSAMLLLVSSCSRTQNWPQFRGPGSNLITSATSLPEEWDTLKNVAWTYELDGAGWGSPVVWGNKIFITSCFPERVAPVPERSPMQAPPPPPRQAGAQPPQSGQPPRPAQGPQGPPLQEDTDTAFKQDVYRWEVTCIDLGTGKQLWKQVAFYGNPRIKKHAMNNYATETAATDGKRVYAYFGNIGLFVYEMDGTLLWKKNFGAYEVLNGWGTGSCPVVYNGTVFIQNDNEENSFLAAVDASTGEEKWRVQRDEKTNYSTPVVWKNSKRTELVAGGKTIRSYDPLTGRELWSLRAGGEMNIPSSVGDQELFYTGNTTGQNAKGALFAVKAGAEGDITPAEGAASGNGVAWMAQDAALGNPSPLLYNGYIYIVASRGGEIKCIDAADGSLVYKDRIAGLGAVWASPWGYDGRVWLYDENGTTYTLQGGDAFKYEQKCKLDDKIWASVAITGDAYIFRGVKNLYCIQ